MKTKCVWDEVPGVNANFKMFFSCSLIVLHRLITMGNYLLKLLIPFFCGNMMNECNIIP